MTTLDYSNADYEDIPNLSNHANVELLNLSFNNIPRLKLTRFPLKVKFLMLEDSGINENVIDTTKLRSSIECLIIKNNYVNIFNGGQFIYLRLLDISYCRLTKIVFPPNIEELDISYNDLIGFGKLPKHLKKFHCSNNYITELGVLNDGLEELNCSQNEITALTDLPDTLDTLDASNNSIEYIRKLPNYLRKLDLSKNNIVAIVDLPESLLKLNLDENYLEKIPELPDDIEYLSIKSNNITTIFPTHIPKSVKYLDVRDNDISYIHPSLKTRGTHMMKFRYDNNNREYDIFDDHDDRKRHNVYDNHNYYSNNNYNYYNSNNNYYNNNYNKSNFKNDDSNPLCVSVYNNVKMVV